MADKELSKKDIVHIWMEKDEADKAIYQRAMDICRLFEEKKLAVYFQYDREKFIPGFYTFHAWSYYSDISFDLLDLSKDQEHQEEITEDNSTLVVKINFSNIHDDNHDVFACFFIPLNDFCRPDWKEYLSSLLDDEIKKCEAKEGNRKTLAEEIERREYSEYLRLKEIYETKI